jgi:hypothetical protein
MVLPTICERGDEHTEFILNFIQMTANVTAFLTLCYRNADEANLRAFYCVMESAFRFFLSEGRFSNGQKTVKTIDLVWEREVTI